MQWNTNYLTNRNKIEEKTGFLSKAQETVVLTQERKKKLNKSETERTLVCIVQGAAVWKLYSDSS